MVSKEFYSDIILPVALWPWVDSASNRNEYQVYFLGKGGRCLMLTTLPTLCAVEHEIWEHKIPGTLRPNPGLWRDCCTF